jgi:hypothetical protein
MYYLIRVIKLEVSHVPEKIIMKLFLEFRTQPAVRKLPLHKTVDICAGNCGNSNSGVSFNFGGPVMAHQKDRAKRESKKKPKKSPKEKRQEKKEKKKGK